MELWPSWSRLAFPQIVWKLKGMASSFQWRITLLQKVAPRIAGLYEPGVWQRLFGRDLEHQEAAVLGRSLKEGSVIVSVRVPESEAPKVMSLLDSHKPVDVLDRARAYGLVGATTE